MKYEYKVSPKQFAPFSVTIIVESAEEAEAIKRVIGPTTAKTRAAALATAVSVRAHGTDPTDEQCLIVGRALGGIFDAVVGAEKTQ